MIQRDPQHPRSSAFIRGSKFCIESLESRALLAGNGLLGEYFDTADLTTPKFTRKDQQISFDFGKSSPLPTGTQATGPT